MRASLNARGINVGHDFCKKALHGDLGMIQIMFRSCLDRMMYLDPIERDSVNDLLEDTETWYEADVY